MKHPTNREVKIKFIQDDPHCNWCKCLVKDYGAIPNGQRNPKDMATIDHTVSRFMRKKGDVVTKVLACYKCNQQRSSKEDKKYGFEHRKKLSTERLLTVYNY